MKNEHNYDFRKTLRFVHLPKRRDFKVKPAIDEIVIESSWSIIFSKKASKLVIDAAKDLQDYFFTSMEVSLRLERVNSIVDVLHKEQNCIVLTNKVESQELGRELSLPRSYTLQVDAAKVVICGNDDRGVMAGCHYMEDVFNLKAAPILQSKYKEKFGESIPYNLYYVSAAYDATNMLADALEKCGEDVECVQEYFSSINQYKGVAGIFTFKDNGDPVFDSWKEMRVVDGKPVLE